MTKQTLTLKVKSEHNKVVNSDKKTVGFVRGSQNFSQLFLVGYNGVRCFMSIVVIYGFEGIFTGKAEHDYSFPEISQKHRCMLFLLQDDNELDFEAASLETVRFGFEEPSNLRGNPLKLEVLNTDSFKGFAGFYHEAIESGSSLVVYPNT